MLFLKEFLKFLLTRKKFWLLPILIVLLIFGGLIVLTQGTVFAPLIYNILKFDDINTWYICLLS